MKHVYRITGNTSRSWKPPRRRVRRSRRYIVIHARLLIAILALCLLGAVGASMYQTSHHAAPKSTPRKSSTAAAASVPAPAPAAPPDKPFGIAEGDTLTGLTNQQLQQTLESLETLGVSRVRIDVSWADVQPTNAQSYSWGALDRVVASTEAHHLQVLGTLDYTPAWAATAACSASAKQDQKCAPASDTQFAAFVSAAVKRYNTKGIVAWEVWNEPNLEGFWQPAPSPSAYTKLLAASYTAIKQVAPSATVLSGSVGPLDGSSSSISQTDFLAGMYAAGAKPYFDAIGYHPYSYPAPPLYVASWNSWSMMDDLPISVRSIMADNGDSAKQIWVTEYGAPTNGSGPTATLTNYDYAQHPNHVDEALQSAMITQSASIYEQSSWMGSMFYYTYQDAGTATNNNENFFGLVRYNGSKKPAYYALQTAITTDK